MDNDKVEFLKLLLEKYAFIMHEFQFNHDKNTLVNMTKEFIDKFGYLPNEYHIEYTTSLGDKIIFNNQDKYYDRDKWTINNKII